MLVIFFVVISFFWSSLNSCAVPSERQVELTVDEIISLRSIIPSFELYQNTLENSNNINDFYLLFKHTSQYSDQPAAAKFRALVIKKYQIISSDPENIENTLFSLIEHKELGAIILHCHIMEAMKEKKTTQLSIDSLFNSPVYNPKSWINMSTLYFQNLFEEKVKGEKSARNRQSLRYILRLIERLNVNSPDFNPQISNWVHERNFDLNFIQNNPSQ